MQEVRKLLATVRERIKAADALCKERGVTEASEALLQAREALSDIEDDLRGQADQATRLAEELQTLQQSLRNQPELVRHKGVYWQQGDPDPWCPTCWEHDQRALHLNPDVLAGRLVTCKRCTYAINLDNAKPPKKWR